MNVLRLSDSVRHIVTGRSSDLGTQNYEARESLFGTYENAYFQSESTLKLDIISSIKLVRSFLKSIPKHLELEKLKKGEENLKCFGLLKN